MRDRKTLLWVHLICCQGVKLFLLKDSFKVSSQFEFLIFVTIGFWSFVTVWVFEYCHNLSFLILVTTLIFEFCHNLSHEFCHNLNLLVVSKFELKSVVTIWFVKFFTINFFLRFVTIWIIKFFTALFLGFVSLDILQIKWLKSLTLLLVVQLSGFLLEITHTEFHLSSLNG